MSDAVEHGVTNSLDDGTPLRVGGSVTRPTKISGDQPKYTELARKAHLEGVVLVEVIIDEQGKVVNERILEPLPMGLDKAALDTVATWRFSPATFQGRPVKVFYTLEVHFHL
jgi:periplasmic protein TonB